MKSLNPSTPYRALRNGALTLSFLAWSCASVTQAADVFWTGGAASYTNAANWNPNSIPGAADTAINDNGTANVVQINVGDPDWTLGQLRAGNATGNGAFTQNGQTLFITNSPRTLRLGVGSGRVGVYTLNGGAINYGGGFNVGELGTGTLNIAGGSIIGGGNLAVNVGTSLDGVNATVDGGTNKTGYTWFETGFYTPDLTRGIPAAGSTFVSDSDPNTSYTMASSYAGTGSILLSAGVPSASVTLSSPTACSALSFLGSAGNGAVTVNYTLHHADSSTETGTFSVTDWFGAGTVAWRAGGRVPANGLGFQIINDGPNFPHLFSLNITVTNTTSAVTSVDLNYSSGGVACLLALSGSSGGNFSPLAITGYNADMVLEASAPIYVSGAVTDQLNQTAGTIDITGEFWCGNYGVGVYTMSGGTNAFRNWFALGRSGGNGTLNLSGGELNKSGNGDFLVGTGFQAPSGSSPLGTLNHSGGTITSANSVLVPENGPASGVYNMSGGAVLNINNWLAIGRNGGLGELNLTNGAITKAGGGNIVIGASGQGVLNQFGGTLTNTATQTWLGENSSGTWNLNGGSATVGLVSIARTATSSGTLNLNGGVLRAAEVTSGNANGTSQLFLNGGTLQPTGDNANFLHDLSLAYVSAGGAVLDSAGYNITIAQGLGDGGGGGGVVKNGAGTVTLLGANNYSGATLVNAGKLITSTAASTPGNCTVANGAGFGVVTLSANAQHTVANLTLSGAAGSLDFALGAFGNPSTAPLGVSGTFDVNGTVTVNVTDDLPQIGQIPLVQYGARTGNGNFVVGSVPVGVVAGVVTNGNVIALNLTSVNLPRWDGQAGGTWDIGATTNWVNIGTGLPTTYGQGNFVLFDDNALGTTTVNLTATVNPGSVTMNNTALNYALVGSGKISGTIGLKKDGGGTFAMLNSGGNNYTGPTLITNGVLSVTNLANGGTPSAIGASSASATNLVLGAGTLQYAGAPVAINRGFTILNTNSAIDAQGDLTLSGAVVAANGSGFMKRGPARLTYAASGSNLISGGLNPGLRVVQGTMVFDGTVGGQSISNRSEMHVGGTPDYGANLVLSNTTVNLESWFGLGRGNGSAGHLSTLSLYNSTLSANGVSFGWWNNLAGNNAYQTVTLSGSSVLTNRGGNTFNISESGGSTTTVNINDTSVMGSSIRITIASGGENTAGTGVVTVANSGRMISGQYMSIGNGNGRVGTLTVKDSGTLIVGTDLNASDTGSSTGTLNVQDNGVANGNQIYIGKAGTAVGNLNVSGNATVLGRGNFHVGQGVNSLGNVNVSGGTMNLSAELWIGEQGVANWTQSGGAVWSTNWIAIGRNNTNATGTVNISGGSLTELNGGSRFIVGSGGTGTLNISGTAAVRSVGQFQMGENLNLTANPGVNGKGTVSLNGGTLTVPRIYRGAGTATFNFNGGTLVAGNSSVLDFMSGLTTANVQSGGAIIDSGTNIINIGQALLDGGGAGGLTKNGTGTLRLNGVNTYTGTTLVNNGTLGGTGTIAGPVSVAAGASLAPGASIGTLTINNTLTLAASSSTLVEVRMDGGATNDVVTGLTSVSYNGALVVSNIGTNALVAGTVFKLFNAASPSGNFTSVSVLPIGAGTFNPATGELTITSAGALVGNAPVRSGNNLILTGTGGTAGGSYSVVTSTNVAAPLGTWTLNTTGTFNGSGAYSNAIPINFTEPARYFRVRVP